MGTKREKITLQSANEGKITTVSEKDIAQSKRRIKQGMKRVVREYDKKETESQKDASSLILNA